MFRVLVSKFLLALMLFSTAVCADPIVTGSKPFTFIPGTTISSSQVNADFDYIINQVNTNAAKNGANSSITALLGLTTPLAPSMGGSSVYYATTVAGTVDAITVTATTPAISSFSLTAGVSIVFNATGINTVNGPTVNVNGTGAVGLSRASNLGALSLRPGELVSGGLVWATYNGSNWVVLNPVSVLGGEVSIASATTTDLGLVGSRNARVTGTTTITSFGSSANAGMPVYVVKFTGSLTLTHNATSLILPGGSNLAISPGDSLFAEYLGSGNWRVLTVMYNSPVIAMGGVNGLTINNNAGTPTTQVDLAWTGLAILENVTNFSTDVIGPSSKTINAATTGANGLDAGSLANSTWYYVYIISDGASLTAGLMSTSASSPTMPSGYTHKLRVGAFRTGGAATFHRIIQKGNRARYVVVAGSVTPALPTIGSGVSGSTSIPTWTSVGTGNFVPTTATSIVVQVSAVNSASVVMVAPNNGYGAYNSTTNPPYSSMGITSGGNSTMPLLVDILLESTNIFWASNNSSGLFMASGWTDTVNAN